MTTSHSSYPLAPTLRKLDTPLLDYDAAAPLGLAATGLFHRFDLTSSHHHHHPPLMPSKSSSSRVIIDGTLARQLGVSYSSSRHLDLNLPLSDLSLPLSALDRHPFTPTRPLLPRHSSSLYSSDPLPLSLSSFSTPSCPSRPPQILRPTHSLKLPPSSAPPPPTPIPSSAHTRPNKISHPSLPSPSLAPPTSDYLHSSDYSNNSRHSDPPIFMPSPTNRRMGFSPSASREVVPYNNNPSPSDSSESSPDPLLQVSLIALESIWHHDSSDPSALHSLLYFIKEVLRRSRTNPNTLKIGLFYLHQSRRLIRHHSAMAQESPPFDDPVLSGRKMFLAALMCASKYLQDSNFSNRAWARISNFTVPEVNANERVFLALMDYQLHVDLHAFDVWSIRLQKLMDEKVMGRARATTKSPSDSPNSNRTPERPPPIRSSSCTEGTPALSRSTPAPGRHHTLPIVSRPPAQHTPLHARALKEQLHQASPLRQQTTPLISRPSTHSSAPHYFANTRRSTYDHSHPSSPLEHHTHIHLSSGSSGPPSRAEISQIERGLYEKVVRERSYLERERNSERRMREEENKAQIRKLIELKKRVAETEELTTSSAHSRGSFMNNLYTDPTRRPASSTSSCGIEDQPPQSSGDIRSNGNNPRLISARPIY